MNILGESEDPMVWKNNLFKAIKNISDIEMQRLSWNGLTPCIISSFSEIINTLYDDCDFNRYIAYYKQTIGQNKLLLLMIELDILISNYHEPEKLNQILNDHKWIEICIKAKEIYDLEMK